jgi:nicotinate-nucleotide--dimethylbenzimidazole phosphoribosyltransferase
VVRALPGNALLLGEMGIGNTSAAALLLARLAGLDDRRVHRRGHRPGCRRHRAQDRRAAQALDANAGATAPLAALAALGGFEVATMVGAVLQAAAERRVIVVDGFITSAPCWWPAACSPMCCSAACSPTARASAAMA